LGLATAPHNICWCLFFFELVEQLVARTDVEIVQVFGLRGGDHPPGQINEIGRPLAVSIIGARQQQIEIGGDRPTPGSRSPREVGRQVSVELCLRFCRLDRL
jgi:hypothetical protein